MKLELREIKHAPSLSEETYAYTATVYKDGKRLCYVKNDGQGGSDMQHPVAPFTHQDVRDVSDWLKASTPKVKAHGYEVDVDLDLWCHDRLGDYIQSRKLKSDLRGKVLMVEGGKLFAMSLTKFKGHPVDKVIDHVAKKYPKAPILNRLPFEQALEAYKAAAA